MELISAGTLEKIFAEHKRKTEELLPALIKRLINSSCPDANLRIPEEDDIWAPMFMTVLYQRKPEADMWQREIVYGSLERPQIP